MWSVAVASTLIGVVLMGGACLNFTAAAAELPADSQASAPHPAAQSVMQLSKPYPEVSRVVALLKNYDDVSGYLGNPSTVCTFFAPSNTAVQQTLDLLKQYAGIVAANDTLQQNTFNYHIIPGKALTMTDLMKLNKTSTRSNETLYMWHRNGQLLVYSRPEYPVVVKKANIKAGKCLVHIIDTTLVPPSGVPLVSDLLQKAGTEPPKPSVANFAPIQDEYLQTYVDAANNMTQTNSTMSNNSDVSPPPSPAPGKSSASWATQGISAAAFVGVFVAAAML